MSDVYLTGPALSKVMGAAGVSIGDLASQMDASPRRVRDFCRHGIKTRLVTMTTLATIANGLKPLYDELAGVVQARTELCQSYVTDLTVHDKAMLQQTVPGDEMMWLARIDGTQMIRIGTRYPEIYTYWIGYDGLDMRYAHLRVLRKLAGTAFGTLRWVDAGEARRLAESSPACEFNKAA